MNNALRYPGQWSLSAEDKDTLRLFVERAEEFSGLGAFGYPAGATIGIRGGQAYSEAELPDERHLRVAAQAARHFYLQKERLQFGRICNLLYCATQERRFRDEVARVRRSYNDRLNSSLSPSAGGSAVRTRADLVDAYFNGAYFHSDPAQRQYIRSLDAHCWGPLFKQQFAQTLMEIFGHVQSLVPVAENALGVDQMAPCPASKRIQEVLAEHGLGPAIILVRDCLNCGTDPPTVTLKCDIELHVPSNRVGVVAGRALNIIQEARSGYPEYSVWWLGDDGLPQGVVCPSRASPQPPDQSGDEV